MYAVQLPTEGEWNRLIRQDLAKRGLPSFATELKTLAPKPYSSSRSSFKLRSRIDPAHIGESIQLGQLVFIRQFDITPMRIDLDSVTRRLAPASRMPQPQLHSAIRR